MLTLSRANLIRYRVVKHAFWVRSRFQKHFEILFGLDLLSSSVKVIEPCALRFPRVYVNSIAVARSFRAWDQSGADRGRSQAGL
jgi:hypothetical protein